MQLFLVYARGFTLVELLITIAVIGILATVVLGALTDARDRGLEAKISSEMEAITNRAAINESSSFSYDSVCGSNGVAQGEQIQGMFASIDAIASSSPQCFSDTEAYAITAPVGTGYLCMDSEGARVEIASALPTDTTVCPAP